MCNANSPNNPQWTTTTPKIFWTHLFCGQITSGKGGKPKKACGFHSKAPDSDWSICVTATGCTYRSDLNGECSNVAISKQIKSGGSSVFPDNFAATDLVNTLVKLATACPPPNKDGSGASCFKDCNYKGTKSPFDLVMIRVSGGGVLTAYPTASCGSKYTHKCEKLCTDLVV